MNCHIQLHHEGRWVEAARIGFSDGGGRGFHQKPCVFEYDIAYALGNAPLPISLSRPVDIDRHAMTSGPAFLYDLVPQGEGRRFLLDRIGLPDAPMSDLPLLLAGAFNPIGRLRIREAVEYFEQYVGGHPTSVQGFDLDELLSGKQDFHEAMNDYGVLATGGTGIQGIAPKHLLTVGCDGKWYPDAMLADARAQRHYIVKCPRGATETDRKILRNEAHYLEVARRFGIRSFEPAELRNDMLFVPRFDRKVDEGRVLRFHQESAASIAGLGGFGTQADQFSLLSAIRSVVDAPLDETIEFIRRDVLNLAMRNPDNHARNTAIQTVDGITRLTPLFDFAPMYLDPEGISRSARWYRAGTRKELTQWKDVIRHLGLPASESVRLIDALLLFGEQLTTLPDCMRDVGIDEDIVDFVTPSIKAQRAQLMALER